MKLTKETMELQQLVYITGTALDVLQSLVKSRVISMDESGLVVEKTYNNVTARFTWEDLNKEVFVMDEYTQTKKQDLDGLKRKRQELKMIEEDLFRAMKRTYS